MTADVATARLGFVGAGTITAAIVTGLCSHAKSPHQIWLSPRNKDVAGRLASAYPQVRVAASNQAVLDHSDVVILAIRPQIAADVVAALKFAPRHHVINLIATFSRDEMTALVTPASRVTCAVPLPSVALGLSPTAIYPPDPVVFALFESLGIAVQVETQSAFRALQSASAAMAAHFATLDALSEWLGGRGVDAKTARDYVGMMSFGLGQVMHSSGLTFRELAAEFKTKGGLNEQFADHLETNGVFEAYVTGLDAILARIDRGAGLRPAQQEPGAAAG